MMLKSYFVANYPAKGHNHLVTSIPGFESKPFYRMIDMLVAEVAFLAFVVSMFLLHHSVCLIRACIGSLTRTTLFGCKLLAAGDSIKQSELIPAPPNKAIISPHLHPVCTITSKNTMLSVRMIVLLSLWIYAVFW
jgi:hypothetical protein